jgi:hypothetical protein
MRLIKHINSIYKVRRSLFYYDGAHTMPVDPDSIRMDRRLCHQVPLVSRRIRPDCSPVAVYTHKAVVGDPEPREEAGEGQCSR